jgi:hypothetical protein
MLPRPYWARPGLWAPLSHTQAAKLDAAADEDDPEGQSEQEEEPLPATLPVGEAADSGASQQANPFVPLALAIALEVWA